MRVGQLAVALGLVLSIGPTVLAQGARESMLVTVDELARQTDAPDLVLLHVGERAGYDKGHLPGARFLALSAISQSNRESGGLVLEMLPAGDLRDRLAELGILDDSRIVVYVEKDWVSPATRVVFTLDYAGLGARTRLLDGGQPAWVKAGRSLTTDVPPARTGQLGPLRLRPLVVDAEFVRARRGQSGVALVDARNREFYDGTQAGGPREQPHRAGHIAGAVSVPFDQVFDEDLHLRSRNDLEALFARAGIAKGDLVVAYCHVGQQATAVLFAARSLGHEVRLYDGSFDEWTRHPDWPVETTTPSPKRD